MLFFHNYLYLKEFIASTSFKYALTARIVNLVGLPPYITQWTVDSIPIQGNNCSESGYTVYPLFICL